jgi:hypothetical protein
MTHWQLTAVGQRSVEERKHLEPIKEHVVLAVMEGAGMLISVEENLASAMDEMSDQLGPEALEAKRGEFLVQIEEGRHKLFVEMDPTTKHLLERAARGEVAMPRFNKRRH